MTTFATPRALIIAAVVCASGASVHAQEPVALTGATLIDGRGGAPVPNATIVLRNGRIECAGARGTCAVPSGVRTIDVSGRWIMPGIVDAHVHYSQTGWADGRPDALDMRERFPYEQTIEKLKDPRPFYRAYLCSGVTATFDVGGFPFTWSLRSAAERDPAAPHVSAAGPLLSTRDHWLNVPDARQFLYMSSDSAVLSGARFLVSNRTDAIKVWFLANANSPDTTAWKQRIRLAGAIARGAGMPLIVHATGLWQAKQALHAGATLLVHGVTDRAVDDEFIQLAKRNGTVYTPTLVVNDGYRQLRARAFDRAAYGDALACVDPATRAKAFLTDSLPGAIAAQQNDPVKQAAARRFAIEADNIKRLHAAGVPIAMGTDAGNPLTLHGPSVYLEMEALHAAGLTPLQVIVAATRNGAMAMGRLPDFGTIEHGKLADLVVLSADPLADIRNVRNIELVVRGGTVHRRTTLRF